MRQHSIHRLSKSRSGHVPYTGRIEDCVPAPEFSCAAAPGRELRRWEMITVHTDDGAQIAVDLADLSMRPQERSTIAALIRGVAAAYMLRGVEVDGFEVEMQAKGLPGNGLTTNYGFALLIAGIVNEMFCERRFAAEDVAEIARYAETMYFGKPSNRIDPRMASVSGVIYIGSSDAGVKRDRFISICFNESGLCLRVVDRGEGDVYSDNDGKVRSDDVRETCEYFGKRRISEIEERDFFRELPNLRGHVSDKSIFSAIRAYQTDRAARQKMEAMEVRDFDAFVHLLAESDRKAWVYLQE